MKGIRLLLLAFLSCLFFTQAGIAGETTQRQHGAHEHGTGILHAVIEGKKLYMKMIMPAVNIVGFEHHPKNTKQKEAVLEAIKTLEDVRKVFTPAPAAQCTVSHVKVSTGILDDEHDEEMHSEFHAEYQFACDAPDKLASVDTNIFKLFKGTEELDARIITPNGQTSQELTSGSARLKF